MGDRPLSETALIAAAKRGDLRSYEEIVKQHQTIAYRVAYLITGSAVEAEEAAQVGFVKAFRSLAGFRAGSEFRPWLLQIVANEARDRRAAAGRRRELALRVAGERRSDDAVPSPETALLDSERRRSLLRAIRRLDRRDQEVIAYRHLLELSVAETAAALGWRAGTVKSRLARALGRLRLELEAAEPERERAREADDG